MQKGYVCAASYVILYPPYSSRLFFPCSAIVILLQPFLEPILVNLTRELKKYSGIWAAKGTHDYVEAHLLKAWWYHRHVLNQASIMADFVVGFLQHFVYRHFHSSPHGWIIHPGRLGIPLRILSLLTLPGRKGTWNRRLRQGCR